MREEPERLVYETWAGLGRPLSERLLALRRRGFRLTAELTEYLYEWEMSEMSEERPGALAPAMGPGDAGKLQVARSMEISHGGIQIRNLADLLTFSAMVVKSGTAPKSFMESKHPEGAVALAVQMGMEAGLSPMRSLMSVFVVNGRPGWMGDAALALVRSSRQCNAGYPKFGVLGTGPTMRGWCESWRVGYAEPTRTEFSQAQAVKAGLWQKPGPWQQYPDRQLMWRAVGHELKQQFSDVLLGFPLLSPDELPDAAGASAPPAAPQPTIGGGEAVGPDPLVENALEVGPLSEPAESSAPSPDLPEEEQRVPPLELTRQCSHPSLPPSKFAKLAKGKTLVCLDCGEELTAPQV